MPMTISLPDELVERLGRLAVPFVDHTPIEVISRLATSVEVDQVDRSRAQFEKVVVDRFPRQRGIRVRLNGDVIVAHSVRDLYEQSLRAIENAGKLPALTDALPLRTSSRRYLASTQPTHPNGKPFFLPVQYGGIYMETHKSYETAVSHLASMLSRIGISFQYVD